MPLLAYQCDNHDQESYRLQWQQPRVGCPRGVARSPLLAHRGILLTLASTTHQGQGGSTLSRNFKAVPPVPKGNTSRRKWITGILISLLPLALLGFCISAIYVDDDERSLPSSTRPTVSVPTRSPVSSPTPSTATRRPTEPISTRPPARTPTPTLEQRANEEREIRLKQQEHETKAEVIVTLIIGILADETIDEQEKLIFCAALPGWLTDLTEARDHAKEYRKIDSKLITSPVDLDVYEDSIQVHLELLPEIAKVECP